MQGMIRAAVLLVCLSAGRAWCDSTDVDAIQQAQKQTDETVSGIQSTLTRLQRTRVGGYVQARATQSPLLNPETNLFVRRARLNIKHSWDRGAFALSFDGGQNTVTVKDAYVDFSITPAREQQQGLVVRAGQFFRPFGLELERSDSVREFLERPVAWDLTFPGNRDQGFDLSFGITPALVANAAILNGGGTSTTNLSFRDADDCKDIIVRVRYSLFGPRADAALSFYDGEQTIPAVAGVPATLGFVDVNANGQRDAGEDTVVVALAKAAVPEASGARDRWGVALNVYDLLGGTVRGEWMGVRDLTTNLAGSGPSQREATGQAWFVQYTHALPWDFGAGARYEAADPDTKDDVRIGSDGEQQTLGLVLWKAFGDNTTFTLLWEHQIVDVYRRTMAQTDRVTSDPLTFQLQYAF